MRSEKQIFFSELCKLMIPIAFQSFMLAAVAASDSIMLGIVSQDALSAVVAFMRQSQTALTKGETVTPPVDSHIGIMKTADNEFEFAYNHNGVFFTVIETG